MHVQCHSHTLGIARTRMRRAHQKGRPCGCLLGHTWLQGVRAADVEVQAQLQLLVELHVRLPFDLIHLQQIRMHVKCSIVLGQSKPRRTGPTQQTHWTNTYRVRRTSSHV